MAPPLSEFSGIDLSIVCGSFVFVVFVTFTLTYLCWYGDGDSTKLRIACLGSNILLYPLSIAMIVLSLRPGKSLLVVVPLHSLAMAVFTTVLTGGLIFMGKRLRQKREWKTTLFKLTIVMLVLYDVTVICDVVLYLIRPALKPELPVLLAHLSFAFLTTLFATAYAFFLVITVHIDAGRKTQHYIPVHAAAVGTWYLICTGSLVLLTSVVSLTYVFVVEGRRWGMYASATDVVLSSCITLSLALPPPKPVVARLRRMIVGRRINHVTLLDRGVLTNGLVEERVYT